MKRVCGHVLAALAVLAGGASVTSACVHDDSTIFVFDVLAPQEVSNGESCVFTSDTTQPYISSGVIDIDFGANGYFAEYLVGNQMVPQGNPSTPQNETSYVTIRNVVVRITDTADPPNQLATFTQAASATIPPLNGTTPSFAPIGVLTIDHNTLMNPNVFNVVAGGGGARLLTYVIFKGITTGRRQCRVRRVRVPGRRVQGVPDFVRAAGHQPGLRSTELRQCDQHWGNRTACALHPGPGSVRRLLAVPERSRLQSTSGGRPRRDLDAGAG